MFVSGKKANKRCEMVSADFLVCVGYEIVSAL